MVTPISLLRRMLRGARHQVRHVAAVEPRLAEGLVAEVYRQLERDFGMLAPPVLLHSPAPEAMAASWLLLRESLLADGPADRVAKESVATAVSEANQCPYCVVVHEASQRRAGGFRIEDPLRSWAQRGGPEPFPPEHRADHLAVAVTFDYLNRMVNVFLPDSPVPARAPEPVAGVASRLLGRVAVADRSIPAGESARLLPAAELPADLAWAALRPELAAAVSAASAVFDACGSRSVPEPVRELVLERLAAGAGPEGPSREWVERDLTRLPEQQRTAGRLALVTALASYQADDGLIESFRREGRDDTDLIELTAWASWAAARRRGADRDVAGQ